MFPRDSAFTTSAEAQAYMESVRDRALQPDSPEVHESLKREAEKLAEDYEHYREQLRNEVDR